MSAEVARDEITSRRMDVQMNAYPGPGAKQLSVIRLEETRMV